MATYKEVKEIFEKNNIDHDEYKKIYNQVLKVNSKLQALDKTIEHWEDLHPHQIEMVLKYYHSDDILDESCITMSLKEYYRLKKKELKLEMLEVGGLDNWQWYGESLYPEYAVDDRKNYDERCNDLKNEILYEILGGSNE
jgi:hypothetical protein